MRRGLLGLLGVLILSSCSYVAGEAAANYSASGGKTIGYVENRPISATLGGHAASIGVGLILETIGGFWLEGKVRENMRKLAFKCMMEGLSEVICRVGAEREEKLKSEYFIALNAGKCTKVWWNPFSAFNKCYDEAFAKVEEEIYEGPLENAVYRIYFNDAYIDCMPDPVKYRGREEELVKKHQACLKEAERRANEEMAKIAPELNKYLAKRKGAEAEG